MTNQTDISSHHKPSASHTERVISSEELRNEFRAFVNDDSRFRKFIESCNKVTRERRRLTFWQQDLWKSFTDTQTEFGGVELSAILDAFHLCHVHFAPLRRVDIPIRKGLWCATQTADVEEKITSDAPYSEPYALDSAAWGEATHVMVDHCDECLSRRRQVTAQ